MSTVNEYFKELGFSSAVNSAQPRISSADLQGFIKEGKWALVKKYVDRLWEERYGQTRKMSFLLCTALVRLGDLDNAIKNLPGELMRTKEVLISYRQCFENSFILSAEQARDVERKLVRCLNAMESLGATYEKEKEIGFPESDVFDHIVSHHPYIILKDCSRLLGEHLLYEKYLREAIRRCPFEKEKKELIGELKIYISDCYGAQTLDMIGVFSFDVDKQINAISQDIFYQILKELRSQTSLVLSSHGVRGHLSVLAIKIICQLLFKYHTSKQLENCLELFVTEGNIDELKKACEIITNISTKRFNEYWGLSASDQQSLDSFMGRLNGIMHYYKGEYRLAAHEFELNEEYLLLGLAEIKNREYAKAINAWEKLEIDEQVAQNIFAAMNQCDTIFIKETSRAFIAPLGHVGEAQVKVLRIVGDGAKKEAPFDI